MRTLKNIKTDIKFMWSGKEKKKTKAHNNVTYCPIWNINLTQITPPYLHLLLGIVKKHHTLLEQDCHQLDMKIAQALAKENDSEHLSPAFRSYISGLRKIKAAEKNGCIWKEWKEWQFFKNHTTLPHT